MTNSELSFDQQRPETWPAYEFVARAEMGDTGQFVHVGIKNTGLDLYLQRGVVLHYDLEGRLLRAADPPLQWRRGLSQRMIRWRRLPDTAGSGFETRMMDVAEADALLDRFSMLVRPLADMAADGRFAILRRAATTSFDQSSLHDVLRRAARFNAAQARIDHAAFRTIYGDVPILPPDQYNALTLMATDGCRYNRCTFCDFYRSVAFHAKTAVEFSRHVRAAIKYHGAGLKRQRSIFLGQANALVGDADWRESIFQVINQYFEFPTLDTQCQEPQWWCGSTRRFTAVASFVDAFTGVNLTADDFEHLRQIHLKRVFIGMESGDCELLRWLRKPGSPAQILETVHAAKHGGLQVGVIVLLGAGGDRFAQQHVKQTIELVRAMALGRGDYVYLSPLVATGRTDYTQRAHDDGIRALSPAQIAAQEHAIRAGIKAASRRDGPYVAHYEVAQFVY